jgi:hypothetical protein
MEKELFELHVRCPECGSTDIQVESYLAADGIALEWGGFYCISCGYLVPKSVAGDDESAISNTPVSLEVHKLCALAELAFCLFIGRKWKRDIVGKNTAVGGYELKIRTDHSAQLVVRKDDIDERTAVLITTTDGRNFCIRGVFNIGEAKRHPEWLG